ncbi:MAG: zinc-dependent alcohol dehydrogenase family protein [Gemmatimonadota bacterium]|nr:zinc-dependent alcohol dehydrogenase family protein [Gemmatimonadota bacterium]
MKAALMVAFEKPLVVREVPDPKPSEDGVVIKVEANGICRSDWHAWMGHDPGITEFPHVPGHEMAGVISAAGARVQAVEVGDRVTVPFCCGCGYCLQCQAGNQHICDNEFQPGFTGWGSFAEYVAIPYADTNIVKLPDKLEFVEAASLGCRFMTAFRGVVHQGQVTAGKRVAVYGCGGVGLSAIMIATALGGDVIGVDIDDAKLDQAEELGAKKTVNSKSVGDPAEHIRMETDGGVDVSIDALGLRETCRNSVRSLRKRGRHVQIGLTVAEECDVAIPMNEVVARELDIVGSHGMQAHGYDEMLQMITAGMLRPDKLIGKRVSLEEAGAELEAMGRFAQQGVTVIDRF